MSENIEFTLEDAAWLNREYPRTFLRPSESEIDELDVGGLVKLIFVMEEPKEGCGAERMWVEITERDGDLFQGILTSEPRFIESIQPGDVISFSREHIAAVYVVGKAPFDANKYATITRRALENRQINVATRTVDLIDEQDSGWTFSFGDEDEEYYENYENGAIIFLKDALAFEPLLERILGEDGYYYEFREEENAFVGIE